MSKSAAEVLRAARALIERPEAWTQGTFARDASGERVDESWSTACCWCADGAIWRAASSINSGRERQTTRLNALRALQTLVGGVWSWNDAPARTHAEVLAAFDKAIQLAEAQQ